MAKTKTWFIPTSPRSPHKIRDELDLLARFEGYNWWEKDDEGRLIHQLGFSELLAQSDFFEGTISEKYPDFSARDRCRAIFMFGFAYIDQNKILHITPAGRRLIDGVRIKELFLKQMLKWQFPSWQHGGNPSTAHLYPTERMSVFPFVETLRVVKDLEGVTKEEIAMFLLPSLNKVDFEQVVPKITTFREELEKQKSGRPRKQFVFNYHLKVFSEVYAEDIETGEISTRESITETERDFLMKKRRNSLDYADAVIRYFQYTDFFTKSFNKLVISRHKIVEVDRILKEMSFELKEYYDVDVFYRYMGDSSIPSLPWENISDMEERIKSVHDKIKKYIDEIRALDSSFEAPSLPKKPSIATVDNLSDYFYNLEHLLRELKKELLLRDVQRPNFVENIIEMYKRILDKDVIDPALFFEWNTWRAMLALNDCYTKPNFQLDNELMPISIAGGRKPDIEVYYKEDYVVLTEVTLSMGERQYDTEAEPVTRHVARFIEKGTRYGNDVVYGLFIAPKINPYTCHYFYVHLKEIEFYNIGFVKIIPLPLNEFISFLRFCTKRQCFNKRTFKELLGEIDNLKDKTNNGTEWYKSIIETVHSWMRRYGSQPNLKQQRLF